MGRDIYSSEMQLGLEHQIFLCQNFQRQPPVCANPAWERLIV